MEYSKRLGSISGEQFQKALDKFSLGRFIKAEAVPFGNFGQNVFITSTKGKFVLRGKPHYKWQFKSEQIVAKLLHEQTSVPVPWPYLVDTEEDIFGWSYVIMPKMPGLQLSDKTVRSKFSKEDIKEIAKALGRNLLNIHTVKWGFCGKYDHETDKIEPFEKPFFTWLSERIFDFLDKSASYNKNTTGDDVQWVKSLLAKSQGSLDEKFSPTLVMQDYKEGNLTVDKISDEWIVTGVFDLMETYFGHQEADLSRTFIEYKREDEELAYLFLKSYFENTTMKIGFSKRFPVFIVLDRSIIWEWAQRNGKMWWQENLTFREWCEPFCELNTNKLIVS